MNVPFTLRNDAARRRVSEGGQGARPAELKGHRSVGGMRASIYNAMPIEGVQALVEFMREFEAQAWLSAFEILTLNNIAASGCSVCRRSV